MNILQNLARWPISNQKAEQICANLNSSVKKKEHRNKKFWKKCHFGGWNDGIWPKNDEPLVESYSLTHFQSKKLYKFTLIWIPVQHKTSIETKIKKKCYFEDQNTGIWLKNDELPVESCSLNYFQSKSCINLHEFEFWRKIKRAPEQKFWKKCHFRG